MFEGALPGLAALHHGQVAVQPGTGMGMPQGALSINYAMDQVEFGQHSHYTSRQQAQIVLVVYVDADQC